VESSSGDVHCLNQLRIGDFEGVKYLGIDFNNTMLENKMVDFFEGSVYACLSGFGA